MTRVRTNSRAKFIFVAMRGALPWRLVELELAAHEEGWQAYHEIASASAFLGGFALFLLYYRSNAADFSQPWAFYIYRVSLMLALNLFLFTFINLHMNTYLAAAVVRPSPYEIKALLKARDDDFALTLKERAVHNAKRAKLVFLRSTAIHRRRAMLSFFSAIPFLLISLAAKQFDGDAEDLGFASTLCFFILIGGVVVTYPIFDQTNLLKKGVNLHKAVAGHDRDSITGDERNSDVVNGDSFKRSTRMLERQSSGMMNRSIFGRRGSNLLAGQEGAEAGLAKLRVALRNDQAKVLALFKEWDEDGDGTVSKREFRRAMPLLGLKAPKEHLDALFDSFDPDGSGIIDYDEFRKIFQADAEPLKPALKRQKSSNAIMEKTKMAANRVSERASRVSFRSKGGAIAADWKDFDALEC